MQTVDYNKFEDGMKAAIVEGAAEYEPVSHVPSIQVPTCMHSPERRRLHVLTVHVLPNYPTAESSKTSVLDGPFLLPNLQHDAPFALVRQPETDKFSFAMVAPRGQIVLRGKVSESVKQDMTMGPMGPIPTGRTPVPRPPGRQPPMDMTAAAIGKAKAVIADKSEKSLVAKPTGGLCYVLCCMLPCTLCCGCPLKLKGAVPVKMDNDEIGSFAVAGANDPNRDREMAVKALTAVGFTEAAGVFSPPSN
jgi:hypothetical protein